MDGPLDRDLEKQLSRQSLWLRESWLWLLRTKVLASRSPTDPDRLSALDVGCGPGFVMDILKAELDVVGVDIDTDMVSACTARGLDVAEASAYDLPHEDGSFDVVYCTFLLLWLDDPGQALGEMARVSRRHVLCLAEPDFGGRVDHPGELARVRDLLVEGFAARGIDPHMGRKLRELYTWVGVPCEVGVHPGVWDIERLRTEFEEEWGFVRFNARHGEPAEMERLRSVWEKALEMGTMLSYNPIFYALGRKGP
jgi:SAM-dependent methyltransferase